MMDDSDEDELIQMGTEAQIDEEFLKKLDFN